MAVTLCVSVRLSIHSNVSLHGVLQLLTVSVDLITVRHVTRMLARQDADAVGWCWVSLLTGSSCCRPCLLYACLSERLLFHFAIMMLLSHFKRAVSIISPHCSLVLWSLLNFNIMSAKSFIDFNQIWHVGKGRWRMHDGMQYDPIQCQVHEPFKVGNLAVFKNYLLCHLRWELERIS